MKKKRRARVKGGRTWRTPIKNWGAKASAAGGGKKKSHLAKELLEAVIVVGGFFGTEVQGRRGGGVRMGD